MRTLFPALFLLAVQLIVSVLTGRPFPGVLAVIGLLVGTLTVGRFGGSDWIIGLIYTGLTLLIGLLITGGLRRDGLLETFSQERRSRALTGGIVSAFGALLLGWAILLSEMLR